MNILLISVGKTDEKYLNEGLSIYFKRLKHYVNFNVDELPAFKAGSFSVSQQKEKEAEIILSKISVSDFVVLLDEQGKNPDSIEFSNFLQMQMNAGRKKMVFVIGGPYGFSQKMYERANYKLSLSKMTFSHQMIRLFFLEQLYRAMTILKGEKYHHG
jgi:23S rRNA (pseudouridine1915-N3)-methyltransferase